MSWIVLKNTRKIVFLFLIRGTIPEKVYNLQNCHAKIIQELNGNFDKRSENEIFEIISEISANVENIKYKLKKYFLSVAAYNLSALIHVYTANICKKK